MKVALCVSGLLRTFKQCHASLIKNIIEPNKADLFISTWNILGTGTYKVPGKPWIAIPGTEGTVSEAEVRATYGSHLKTLHIENWSLQERFHQEIEESCRKSPSHVYHDPRMVGITKRITSMHYKIKEANRLRKDYEALCGFKYDVVIRGRADIRHDKMLKMSDFDITWPLVYLDHAHSYGHACDQFSFGTPRALDIYCSVYPKILEYNKEIAVWNPENTMQHHLEVNGVKIVSMNLDYKVVGLQER